MLAALAADRARIADIEAQILYLDHEPTLSALRIEKILVQERLDCYTYPVLTLPNEIAAEIFIHFLPIYPLCPPLTGVLSSTVLTQICRTWREIALATPGLWRAICLSVPERQFKISDTWLSRSRCCPLSVQIFESHYELRASEAFAEVLYHQTRWEHLKLRLARSNIPRIEAMPMLRTLDLTLHHVSDVFQLHEAPLLRTVFLCVGVYQNVILPWAQLTSLTLFSIYPGEYVPILQQTSNLVHCRLDIIFRSEDDHPPDITLPSLESLVLNNLCNAPSATGYLETFIVPALHTLRVTEEILGPNPVRSLTSFISKSGCELERVQILNIKSVTEGSYRQAFPSIIELSVHSWGMATTERLWF
ncbi:hypothetical protein B0H19DRAFT_234215 [Mycena capillaripes]|nr:hypothetical protein B0H19DRAFT_234215 [Mycena capillaripes]